MPSLDLSAIKTRWSRRLVFATAAGAALGVIGPFGSFMNGALPVRLAYWIGMSWVGALVLSLGAAGAVKAAQRLPLPPPLALSATLTLATLAISAPLALIAHTAATHLWPRLLHRLSPLDWYGQSLFVCALALIGAYGIERAVKGGAASAAPLLPVPPETADVICLHVEDHYVHIHRESGTRMRLMRIEDAIARHSHVEGARVHRSWWVARAHVRAVAREGRRVELVLSNGLKVPVARSRLGELKRLGWIEA